ncbi:hypothetical protein PQ455_10205 [Sphingomonas naphthae]|uniref:5-bromo-4-chloroindolyl phosphate hydrolase n=1 Tax=Sphingomonas naphthae TaxID=1813468 RepID=A0ABY7TGC4_9SPHN|nr:hypothetical protein [Sphingomonas naphthae]WCT72021.1 hypothetical protein PQ455_10205 [Sphingomonas naphthae]
MSNDLARITEEIKLAVAARAGEALHHISPEGRRQRQRQRERRRKAMLRTLSRMMWAALAIAIAAIGWGILIAPLGIMGVVAAAATIMLAWIAIISLATVEPAATPQALATSDLPLLPQRTEEWLVRQRPALPAPAVRMVDSINLQLEALSPQLQGIDPTTPVAGEFRKLVSEELPELIQGYQKVPAAMRGQARGGEAPDKHLVEGLSIVKSELERMTSQLASGDLDRLATQNRYLELKYRGAGDEPA